jgi:hypothetical protein
MPYCMRSDLEDKRSLEHGPDKYGRPAKHLGQVVDDMFKGITCLHVSSPKRLILYTPELHLSGPIFVTGTVFMPNAAY